MSTDADLKKVKEILLKYNQEHLLQFYDELTIQERDFLINQILSIPFGDILRLYEKSKFDVYDSTEEIEPIEYTIKKDLSKSQINLYKSIGYNTLKNCEFGVITLAGGQGSRLGFKGPKGTFKLDTKPRKISLFEVLCNYLKNINEKLNIIIPWYIMTSLENNQATVDFFKSENYFNYPPEYIKFFVQDNLPIIDVNGKLVLEETYKVKLASNGNGNLFSSLNKNNLLDDMNFRKLKWLFVGGVDNVLLNPVDPVFIGFTVNSGNLVSSKTLFKQEPDDINWIFARKNGKPAIVDCENFASELSKIKSEDGKYLYRETNMLAHIFNISAIKQMLNVQIPYHRAFRKSPFVNYEGMKQIPESPNIYKFEQFVFDAFSHFDNISLLRVNPNEEFAPIKNFNGPHNPEVAQKMYEKQILNNQSKNNFN